MKTVWCIVSIFLTGAACRCILPSPLALQLVLEYASWRSWDQLVVFDNIVPKNCVWSYVKPLVDCLGEKGITASVQSASNPRLPDAVQIQRHRVGSVVFTDGLNMTSPDNILQMASQKLLFNYYVSWFIVTTRSTDTTIDSILRPLNIGIDSDVVVTTSPLSTMEAANLTRYYSNRTCSALRDYGKTFRGRRLPVSRQMENATANLDYVIQENKTVSFYLLHVYKIRYMENSSMVVDPLGSWNPGSLVVKPPVSVERRNNFHGLPIIVGVLNATNEGQTDTADEEETSDIAPLFDLMTFIASGLNASLEVVPHEKLGTMANKAWSNLLGDVVSGAVDIGLGNINVNDERQREMSFTHPIIHSMRNIYFRPPESGTMRDIFLQPFNNRLLFCVAATCLLIVLATTAINYTASLCKKAEKNAGLGEAALWCISIMCMQGSPWSPMSPSGKIVLLMSLIFALVIYNAYAGFITSILSVQAVGIRSVSDLLLYNYQLGYSLSDDEYIRNVNDSSLRQLYIKAFNGRESRLDTVLGLKKAMKGSYGFFVSARLARRALGTSLLHNRCNIKELVIPQTFSVVALPMAQSCPYKKIINLGVMRIREGGVLARIGERMLPGMPQCEAPTTFHSARLADVYSAFVIMVTGLIGAFAIGIFERIWSHREFVRDRLKRGMKIHHGEAQHVGRSLRTLGHHSGTRSNFPFVMTRSQKGSSEEETTEPLGGAERSRDGHHLRNYFARSRLRSPKRISGTRVGGGYAGRSDVPGLSKSDLRVPQQFASLRSRSPRKEGQTKPSYAMDDLRNDAVLQTQFASLDSSLPRQKSEARANAVDLRSTMRRENAFSFQQ